MTPTPPTGYPVADTPVGDTPVADTPVADASVRFFERAGPDARRVLDALGRHLRAGGAQVELLASLDRDDLWLLVARGDAAAAADPLPRLDPATRTWRFRSDTEA